MPLDPNDSPDTSVGKPEAEYDKLSKLKQPSVDLAVERERRYLVALDALRQYIDLDRSPSIQITQSYFPNRYVESFGLITAEISRTHVPFETKFTQARLRSYHDAFGPHFELQAKGWHPELLEDERIEIHAEISEELFNQLSSFATAGTVEKTRYWIEGHITDSNGKPILVFAEVDLFTHAGRPPKPVKKNNFAFVEVECADRAIAQQLHAGHHDFKFLEKAVDILDLIGRAREVLSNSYFAAQGIDRKVQALARRLLSE